jgi:hypothetical protein
MGTVRSGAHPPLSAPAPHAPHANEQCSVLGTRDPDVKHKSMPTLTPLRPRNLILILICSAGGVILLLATSVLLYIILTRRSSRRSQRHPYGHGNNGGFTGLSSNDLGSKSSFAGWRKCSETDIGNGPHSPITPLSLSGPTFPLPVKSTPLIGSGSGSARGPGAYGQPNGSPPPDYPEYIPYNGPIQALSPPSWAEPPTPPAITGGSASAMSWLKRANPGPHVGGSSEQLVRRDSSQSYQVQLHRQDSSARSRSHSHSSLSSETSGSLALAHVGTARAVGVGATRSVARLWPSRSAVPSDFLDREGNDRDGFNTGVSENESYHAQRAQPHPGHTRGAEPPRPPPLTLASSVQTTAGGSGGALGSTLTLPTSTVSDPTPNGGTTMGGSHNRNQNQMTQMTRSSSNYRYDYNYCHNQAQALGHNHNPASAIYRHPTSNPYPYPYPNASSKTNNNDTHHAPSDPSASASASFSSTPLPSSSVGSVLRRGVSIKSVKTMRSFFSGLLTANPVGSGSGSASGGVPPTPMTSSSREMYPNQYPARPDSDIFPSTLQRSDSTGRMWISPVRRDAGVGGGRVSRGASEKGWDGASERGTGTGTGTERIMTPTTIEGLRTGLSGVSGISASSYPSRSPRSGSGSGSGSGSTSGSGSGSGFGVLGRGRTSRTILPIRAIQPIRPGQEDEVNRDHHDHNGHSDDSHAHAHAPAKWVIELDPNSPITASRPGSEMTAYTSGR